MILTARSHRISAVTAVFALVAGILAATTVSATAAVSPVLASSGFSAGDLDATGQTVPDTAYAVPSGAIYLSTTGSDTNAGTSAAPVKTITKAYALVPAGGTIVVQGGVYRDWLHNGAATSYGIITKTVTVQAAPHQQVWFDGTDVEAGSNWTSDGAGHWYLSWDTPQFCDGHYDTVAPNNQNTNNTGPCSHIDASLDPANPLAGDPQMAFVNGVYQHEVASLSAATAGNFYYDWTAKRLYVASNPSTNTVELAVRPIALVVGADNVTVRGIGFRRYATNEYSNVTSGAIFSAAPHQNTVLENDVFTAMAAQAIAAGAQGGKVVHSVIANNGFTGIGSNGDQHGSGATDNFQAIANVISNNNTEHFDTSCTISCAASGLKLARMDGFTLSGNIVSNNHGGGLWCDLACTNGVMVDNIVSGNTGTGVQYEVSDTGIIASNLITNSGAQGLRVDSADTAVYNNTLVGNLQGISIFDDPRTYGVGGWTDVGPDTKNIRMANNIVSGGNYSFQAYPQDNSSVAPNTGAAQFFTTLDYDSYYQTNGSSLGVVLWRLLAGAQTIYKSVPAFTSAQGWEPHGTGVLTTDTTDPEGDPFFVDAAHGNYTVRATSTAYNSGVALPADVAAAVGLPSGTVTSRGAISWPGVQPTTAGSLVTLPAKAVLDTRTGTGGTTGPIAANQTVAVQVAGQQGVPLRAISAVVLDVSVLAPTGAGYLLAYPDGGAVPGASAANFDSGATVSSRVVVPLSAAGKVDLRAVLASGATTQLTASVSGYYVGGTATAAGSFTPVSTRVLDTRNGTGAPQAKLTSGQVLAVQVGGIGGVPASGVSAVLVNLAVLAPTGSGFLSAYADGATRTVASVAPLTAGKTLSNLAVVPVSSTGKIDLYNYDNGAGTVNLVGDVVGYYRSGSVTAAGNTMPVNPDRVLDTRSSLGATGPVAANGVLKLHVDGVAGVPASGVSAVLLNLTVTASTAAGNTTVYADGTARPAASDLGFTAGQTLSIQIMAPVSIAGDIDIANISTGTTQFVADVAGYVVAGQR